MRRDMRPRIPALLKKDLRVTRVFWIPACFSFGAFLLIFFENSWAFLACGIVLTVLLAAFPMVIDDHYRTDALFAGLPGKRSSLVAGRYLSWGLAALFGLVLFLAASAILLLTLKSKTGHLAPLLSAKGALAFLAGSTLAGMAFLPSYFRFGFWKGLAVFAGGSLALAVVLSFLVPILAPSQGGETGGAAKASGSLAATIGAFTWLARRASQILGNPLVFALTVAGLGVLALASFRLSLAFYKRRDI
jgi:hypothetical protein